MVLSTVSLCRISTRSWKIDRLGFYIIAIVAIGTEFHWTHHAR